MNFAGPMQTSSAMASMSCGPNTFFHGRNVAVLVHGLTKKKEVPDTEIDRAIRRKQAFERNSETHVYEEDGVNGKDERRSQDPGPEDRPQ